MTNRRRHAEETAEEVRRVLRLVLWINAAVVAAKVMAWGASHSLSVFAEATNSTLDALSNLFALGMMRVASRAPDAEHPYGHQKFETLGALVLVGVLSVTVFELAQQAVTRLLSEAPATVQATPLALLLMALSLGAGTGVTIYEHRRGQALGSDLLKADAAHTRADVLATFAVLLGLLVVRSGHPEADPWISLGVAGVIAFTGWRIIREAVPVLVDERAMHPIRIQGIAEQVDHVVSAYGIRSRGRPGDVFAELTIAVAAGMDVTAAHAVADEVERRITAELGARRVVVHVEPYP